MSGSFKPYESLPDADKLAFNELKELYIASEAQHTQRKSRCLNSTLWRWLPQLHNTNRRWLPQQHAMLRRWLQSKESAT
ncbi:hypothetical protein OIU78_000833 [Salix suchowensis]|nr:hypothetical protein OIU78_000833 [Salix suchowensis]